MGNGRTSNYLKHEQWRKERIQSKTEKIRICVMIFCSSVMLLICLFSSAYLRLLKLKFSLTNVLGINIIICDRKKKKTSAHTSIIEVNWREVAQGYYHVVLISLRSKLWWQSTDGFYREGWMGLGYFSVCDFALLSCIC